MFKLNALVIVALAVCVIAEPIRQRPSGRRVLARQQILPTPAPTGYPAAGVTPETPFELPNGSESPENPQSGFPNVVGPQPDEVYGPPELNGQQPVDPSIVSPLPDDEVYGPPEGEPDEIYGPPEFEAGSDENEVVPEIVRAIAEDIDDEITDEIEDLDEEVVVDENGAVISVSSTFQKPARLVYQRFPQGRQAPKAVPARLTAAKITKPANFIYTARFQNFHRNH